jgi:hypothetical protein
MKRRDFVASSLAVAASSLLSGCANYPLVRNPAEVCSPDFLPLFNTPGPLEIDAHCHVFNASDLPVQGFVGEVLTHDGTFSPELGRYVAAVCSPLPTTLRRAQRRKPTGLAGFSAKTAARLRYPAQFAVLRAGPASAGSCDRRGNSPGVEREPGASRTVARRLALRRVAGGRGAGAGPSMEQRLLPLLQGPVDAQSFLALQASPSVRNAQEFLKPMLRFRYTNCYALMKAFSCKPGEVDLYVPSLVDFNYWLGPADTGKARSRLNSMRWSR